MTWLAIKLFLGGKLRSAFGWITASSTHLLIVGCVVLALFALHERHIVHKRDAQLARWPIIYAQERHSFQVERDSANVALNALRSQNKAVLALARAGEARQRAAASAVAAAVERSAHGEVSAARIDQERSERPSQAGCKSGAAVMQARGDL